MPAVNGVVASPPPEHPAHDDATLKRKRMESESSEEKVQVPAPNADERPVRPELVQESIESIFAVLKRHASSSSIFDQSLDLQDTKRLEEPLQKRTKLSNALPQTTIAGKIASKSYSSLDDFATDVDSIADSQLRSAKLAGAPRNGAQQWAYNSEMIEHDRQAADLILFKSKFHNLLAQETQTKGKTVKQLTNGHFIPKESADTRPGSENAEVKRVAGGEEGRTLLTLFGNAQGHKQLFSSFQRSVPKSLLSAKPANVEDEKSNVMIPLRETGLPPGIISTKLPLTPHDHPFNISPRAPTFLETFPPPSSLPLLSPPRTPKPGGSRGSSITWSHNGLTNIAEKRAGYTSQKLNTGQWLGYGGLAPAEEPTSPEAKRKKRDRALSTGEASWVPSDGALAAQMRAKEDALFRSVYSSFAPKRDNSSALITEETKAEVWWDRQGKQFFNEVFAIDPALDDHPVQEEANAEEEEADQMAAFKAAVEAFEDSSVEDLLQTNDEESTNAHLNKVSELLETLHSYQRIRKSSLTPTTRTPISRNRMMHDQPGDPSTPSLAELETYNSLKARLLSIISSLPPYAIAKLNGDQLSDLNVSRTILLENKIYRGVMEEDAAARSAKQAALHAAAGSATMRPMSQHQQGARTAQMGHNSRAPAQSYQGAPRANASYGRQHLNNWQTPAQFGQQSQKPAYSTPHGYNQQTPRPISAARSQQPLPPFPQRPPNYPTQPNGAYQTLAQAAYPPRLQAVGSYNSYAGAGSPPRPGQYSTTPSYAQYSPQSGQSQQYGYRQSAGPGSPQGPAFAQQHQYSPPQLQPPHPRPHHASPTPVQAAPMASMNGSPRPQTPAEPPQQPPAVKHSPAQNGETLHMRENSAARATNQQAPAPAAQMTPQMDIDMPPVEPAKAASVEGPSSATPAPEVRGGSPAASNKGISSTGTPQPAEAREPSPQAAPMPDGPRNSIVAQGVET